MNGLVSCRNHPFWYCVNSWFTKFQKHSLDVKLLYKTSLFCTRLWRQRVAFLSYTKGFSIIHRSENGHNVIYGLISMVMWKVILQTFFGFGVPVGLETKDKSTYNQHFNPKRIRLWPRYFAQNDFIYETIGAFFIFTVILEVIHGPLVQPFWVNSYFLRPFLNFLVFALN